MKKLLLLAILFSGCTVNHYHYDCKEVHSKKEFKEVCKTELPHN